MRTRFALIGLLSISCIGNAQNWAKERAESLIKTADSLFKLKNYEESYGLYHDAFALGDSDYRELYNGARSAALAGKSEEAFEWLNLAVDKGYVDVNHIRTDNDLESLHDNDAWAEFDTRLEELLERDNLVRKEFMNSVNTAAWVLKKYGYKAAVDTLLEIEKQNVHLSHTYPEWQRLYEALMTFYSFAGDNYNSVKYQEKSYGSPHCEPIHNFKVVKAEDYIIKHYGKETVIMINEAHNRGQCRAFVRDMLPALYKAGFRYLAAEAFDWNDSTLNKRGYPVIYPGFYSKEPTFGQLVRDAIAIGFTCIPYEDTVRGQNLNPREEGEAVNLYNFIKAHPGAKVIVYAGHDHIQKKHTSEDWIKMGERLCKKLGHDIPSIETTSLMERNNKDLEGPVYKALADSMKIKVPSIILVNDTPYVVPRQKGFVDACIYLPPTNYDAGYPDWMRDNKYGAAQSLPKDTNKTEVFVQVFKADEYENERENAVPVMQFTMPAEKYEYKLYVKSGTYYIKGYDNGNRLLFMHKVTISFEKE